MARKLIRCGFISKENVDQERRGAFSSIVKRLLRCQQELIEAFLGFRAGYAEEKGEFFQHIRGENEVALNLSNGLLMLKCLKCFKPAVIFGHHIHRNAWLSFFQNMLKVVHRYCSWLSLFIICLTRFKKLSNNLKVR